MHVNFGLPAESIDKLALELGIILANTELLYLKSRNYHWNLEDPRFLMLHELFEKQYDELAEMADLIAERIRTLGRRSPGSFKEFSALATLTEAKNTSKGEEMVTDLAETHEAVMVELRRVIDLSANLGDPGTADLLTDAVRAHEKSAWFLRSHLAHL